jgi:oligopeptidase B
MQYYVADSFVPTVFQVLKRKEVPEYDQEHYECQRTNITAADGTSVPVSMVYRKDLYPEGQKSMQEANGGTGAPLFIYGYGSYGACMEPSFSFSRLPLLDRGVVYAIAHIRGGSEMGRFWYEDEGKYLTKKNTFTDFCDAAKELQDRGVTKADRTATEGASAGGLLMGAVLNMHPELFKVATCKVLFMGHTVHCTHTVLMLYYSTSCLSWVILYTVLILFSYCSHTVLVLYSCCTRAVL